MSNRPTVKNNKIEDSAVRAQFRSIANNIADMFCKLNGYGDKSLVQQIVSYGDNMGSQIRARSIDILASSPSLVGHIADFSSAWTQVINTQGNALGTIASYFRPNPHVVHIFRAGYRAACLDSLLATAEGARSLQLSATDSVAQMVNKAEEVSRRKQGKSGRFTPIGIPTDDTQFMISGILVSQVQADCFPKALVKEWLEKGTHNFRNTGRRTQRFLSGDMDALSGRPSLGDCLRASAFLGIYSKQERSLAYNEYSDLMKLTSAQRAMGLAFLELVDAGSEPGGRATAKALRVLCDTLGPEDRYTKRFFQIAEKYLTTAPSLPAFLAEAGESLGNDYDTYGFIAGLVMPDTHLPSKFDNGLRTWELPPMHPVAAETVLPVLLASAVRTELSDECLIHPDNIRSIHVNAEYKINDVLHRARNPEDVNE